MMCGVLDARRLICCSLRCNHNGPRRTDAARVMINGVIISASLWVTSTHRSWTFQSVTGH